jgi:three-Cys-motif partner protein
MPTIRSPIWEIDPHTVAKHEILKRYLQAWFPILARWFGRIIYLDGFAGPGIYQDGREGSPLIALRCLLEHKLRNRLLNKKREFVFIFIEKDGKRVKILEKVIKDRFQNLPDNVKVHVINAEFAPTMKEILDDIEIQGAKLAPTFAFLDPFGFAGLPLEIISRMMNYDRCEVLITFMSGFVNRFVNISDEREKIFDELFGTDEWRKVREISDPKERRNFIIELYKKQVRDTCKAKYVRSFEMIGEHNQVIYDLVFATKHWKGMEVMKEAMWSTDPRGTYRFSDTTDPGQTYLIEYFEGEGTWIFNAAKAVFDRFRGQEVEVREIQEFVSGETPYLFRKSILKELEKQEKILDVKNRNRPMTYPDGCVIKFSR